MATFNIKSRALKDTTVLHLRDPETGDFLFADEAEKQPLTIELYGRSSKQYHNWANTAMRKRAAEEAKGGKNKKNKTVEETLDETAEFLAALSIKATNFDMDGVAIDTKEAFKKLYADPSLMWINEQVSEVLGDNGAFLQA